MTGMTHAQQLLPHRHPLKGLEAFFTSGNEPTKNETVTIRTSRFFEELAKAVTELEALKAREPMTDEQREIAYNKANQRMSADPELAWRDAIVDEVEAHHNITNPKGGV